VVEFEDRRRTVETRWSASWSAACGCPVRDLQFPPRAGLIP